MDMNYGCDVSNRYSVYLDSSDHGNSMSSSVGKNKRKTKKKRKSKNHKQKMDNCTHLPLDDRGQKAESDGINTASEPSEHQQSFSTEDKTDANYENESIINQETSINSTSGLTSLPSFGSPMQSDISIDATKNDDHQIQMPKCSWLNNETKWSVICFEEEKRLMSQETIDQEPLHKQLDEMAFTDQRVYPTVYFYNSNFGNKNLRRFVYDGKSYRDNYLKNDNTNSKSSDGNEQKRRNENERRRKKCTSYAMSSCERGDTSVVHSTDNDKHTADSHNETNDCASEHTNESNARQNINSKNHCNNFKHGMPKRTFTRRPDFVRNV